MKRASVMALSSLVLLPVSALLAASCSGNETTPAPADEESDVTSSTSATSETPPAPSEGASTGGGTTTPPVGVTSETEGNPPGTSAEPPATGGGGTTEGPTAGASSGDAPATTEPAGETSGPPSGAYERCSGSPLPALDLLPVLLPPKVNRPIDVSNPPGQPNMFYVAERGGAFKRFDMSQTDPTATTLTTLDNVSTSGEYGFLSAALHPNFDGESEKRAYLVYTPAQSFIIKVFEIDGDTATEVDTLFEFTGDTQSNHNGGLALFGPDGYLYVGIGDGGGGNDQHGENGNGQNTNTTYGKILRLDVDDPTAAVRDNLTSEDVGGEMVDGRILHYGLRNPWRFSFDRLNDDLYIGDVGQDTREEVSWISATTGPTNFGWAVREGFIECPGCDATLVGLPATEPIYDYENPPGNQESRSVTGGYVYRGNSIPGLYGRYVFADYQTSVFTILTADGEGGACDVIEDAIDQNQLREQGIASFAEDVDGELYVVSLNDGIFKIVARE